MEGIILIIIGIAFFYMATKIWLNKRKISKTGVRTEGVVFDALQSNGINSQAKYPVIRFVTLKQEWITEEYNISVLPGFLKKGQKIEVIYNPDNPKEFYVKSIASSMVLVFMILLAIIILAIGVYKL